MSAPTSAARSPRRRIPGLDGDLPDEVRTRVPVLMLARLVGNAAFRFPVPFLGVIARGLGVPLTTMGAAASAGEFTGLLAPWFGRRVDRSRRVTAMTVGMAIVVTGAVLASASPGPAMLAVAFVLISLGKLAFDPAVGAWVADRVVYERRGRVTGFLELSWAGAMLVVVPILGLLVAGPGWRWGYAVIALACAAMGVTVRRRLRDEPAVVRHDDGRDRVRIDRATAFGVAGFALLLTASSSLFVVFGAWLGDTFDGSAAGVGLASVLFGLAELGATSSSIRLTDRLGKVRAVSLGAGLMIPAALSLAVTGDHLVTGLVSFGLFVLGFEFAIVSAIPLVVELQPHARASALGMASGAGTIGRGLMIIVSTRLYEAHGVGGSGLLGAGCAVVVIGLYVLGLRGQTRLR